MNIYLRELKANYKSLLIYCGISLFFLVTGFTKFKAYAENPDLLAILDSMPPAMLATFNMNAFNLTTLSGFFGVFYVFLGLILSIAAVMWGSDIISKEERDKTVEFSLTLPVRRSTLITAKSAAALTNCIALALVTWGLVLANSARYNPDAEFYSFVSLGMVSLFIIQCIFLAAGIFLGSAMKKHKNSGSVAVSLLLGTYFISVIAGLNEDFDFLKYFTPFKYFDPASLLYESRIDLPFVWLSAGIIAVALVGAYIAYSKRDLYI
ncbi:MAG: ABC transporter permease subunit [Anaerolineales bacterium]|nr:ABC transporter permease subunit [Anaerolineales bacterium]